MKYIKLFNTVSAYTESRNNDYFEPWLSYTEENDEVNYNKTEDEKLIETPLTFNITGDGNIVWKVSGSSTKTIEYKKNDGEWTEITSTTAGTPISVVSGDTVQFRGDNDRYATGASAYNSFSGTTAAFSVKGNIMSLISSSGFATLNVLTSSYTFNSLMRTCTGLTDASKLVLPATTLAIYCYYNIFQGCTSLTTSPELPATTLTGYCYANMFQGCTSLTTAPELPATVLASYCYNGMFRNCTSLTTAPELPATTLAQYCYASMFYGCTNLTTEPELPATGLVRNCYASMFNGCTNLTTAPELPATTLADSCYYFMFNGCTSLNYIKAMFTTTPGTYTSNWVNGVASTGTFVKNSAAQWDITGVNGIPAGWTVETASA